MTGYRSAQYAASLAEFGQPLELERAGGWLLERQVPTTDDVDAMGCYPLFSCAHWDALADDLGALEGSHVSAAMVVDPFSRLDEPRLREIFRDIVVPMKEHFVVDTTAEKIGNKDHRYKARRALKKLEVTVEEEPLPFLDGWCALYDELIERHEITGVRAFSRASFARQLEVPGMVMFRALHEGRLVGAHLWFVDGDSATSHLVASSAEGYRLQAAYAFHSRAIEHFSERVRWVNLGGGAGTSADATDGLTQFKRGWSTESRTAWFCGRILSPERYERLTAGVDTRYFPAYRAGEF